MSQEQAIIGRAHSSWEWWGLLQYRRDPKGIFIEPQGRLHHAYINALGFDFLEENKFRLSLSLTHTHRHTQTHTHTHTHTHYSQCLLYLGLVVIIFDREKVLNTVKLPLVFIIPDKPEEKHRFFFVCFYFTVLCLFLFKLSFWIGL